MTKKEMFEEMLNLANANNKEEIAKYATHQLELIARKEIEKEEKQKEREEMKVKIIDEILSSNEPKRASEIAGALEISTQKTVPMLRELIAKGKIEKFEANRISYYNIVKE